jgi:hypothetical protein
VRREKKTKKKKLQKVKRKKKKKKKPGKGIAAYHHHLMQLDGGLDVEEGVHDTHRGHRLGLDQLQHLAV